MINFYPVLLLSILLSLGTCQRSQYNRRPTSIYNRSGTPVGQGRTLGLLRPLLGLSGLVRPFGDVPGRPIRPASGVASDPAYGGGGGYPGYGGGYGGGYPGYGGGYSGYGGGYPGYGFGGLPNYLGSLFGYRPFGYGNGGYGGYTPQYGGYGGGYPGNAGYGGAYQGNVGYQGNPGYGGGYQGNVGYQGNPGFGGSSFAGAGYQQNYNGQNGLGSYSNLASAAAPNVGGANTLTNAAGGTNNGQAAQLANVLGQALGASLRPLIAGGAGGGAAPAGAGAAPSSLIGLLG